MFKIDTTPRFDDELLTVLDFIAEDSINSTLEFHDELIEKLHNTPDNPFLYRKRENMNEYIRELIYKGYTIPLYIDEEKKTIFVLGIFNQNLWE